MSSFTALPTWVLFCVNVICIFRQDFSVPQIIVLHRIFGGHSLSEFYGGLSPILERNREGNSAPLGRFIRSNSTALGRFIRGNSVECPTFQRGTSYASCHLKISDKKIPRTQNRVDFPSYSAWKQGGKYCNFIVFLRSSIMQKKLYWNFGCQGIKLLNYPLV